MAWKLRKDKLKAGAVDGETPEDAEQSAPEAEAPVFDLSGSAFLTESGSGGGQSADEPHFEAQPTVHEPIALGTAPIALGSEPISLEPLAPEHTAAPTFDLDPLPEFDPIILPSSETVQPEVIAFAPSLAPDEGETGMTVPPPIFAPDISPQREAIAPALVTTDSESGLPKVAPFIVDTPPAAQPEEEPERTHSVVIRIGNLSATVPLVKPVTTIGRPDSIVENYPDMEVELDDGVSRRHAEIRQEGGGYAIVDTNSTNGTFLNGEMLTPHQPVPLRPGDRIRIGERTELVFE